MTIETKIDLTRKYTADEFFELTQGDDGKFYELDEGKIIEMSPASRRHGRISMKLVIKLGGLVYQRELGEVYGGDTGVTLGPATVRSPDVSFVKAERLVGTDEDKFVAVAPDLAVEVISPGDTLKETREKAQQYLRAGVRLVWVINPRKKQVEVYRPNITGYTTLGFEDELSGEDVVEGFKIAVKDLF